MENLRDYAKLGLVYHMLYPHCMSDADYHAETLVEFVERSDIETFDCCVPYGEERRRRCLEALRNCGKDVVFALHLWPARKISLASVEPHEQGLAQLFAEDQIKLAVAAGASGFVFPSGIDVPEDQRPKARDAFADFCRWFGAAIKPHGMTATIEPFDRDFDKKYLYGPTSECAELMESLRPGTDNVGIELDMAHVPLMGEAFEEAIRTVAPYLMRVHLGNCVMKDPSSPWYGDYHPPIGFEGGEIDVPELVRMFRALLDIGYLNQDRRGPLVLEMQPFPDKTEDETVRDNMARIERAWEQV